MTGARAPTPSYRPAGAAGTDSIAAVVLDLDGTLVDTAPDLVGTLNAVLERAGRERLAPERMRTLVSGGARGLMRTGFALTGAPAGDDEIEALVPDFLAIYDARLSDASRPYPGVAATLAALRRRGARLGVCTNKPHGLAVRLLERLDLLRRFDAVLGGDSIEVRKPHPRHIEATLDALGCPAARAVMVGDSVADVEAARGAGVPVILAGYGYGIEHARAAGGDGEIAAFSELPRAIAALR